MEKYVCWTKYGEQGITIEDNEEEDFDDHFPGNAGIGAFDDKQKDEPKRHIVLSEKRNIIGVEDKTDLLEEYNNFVVIPPFEVNADPCILLANDDAPYLRRDHNQGTTANPSCT